jgi:hypothetical protein
MKIKSQLTTVCLQVTITLLFILFMPNYLFYLRGFLSF